MVARMSKNSVTMFDYLSKKYGISKTWMASQLGMSYHAFLYALERGLTEDEVLIMEEAIRSAGKDLMAFKVPANLKQKKMVA
jgi:hypothetical protein